MIILNSNRSLTHLSSPSTCFILPHPQPKRSCLRTGRPGRTVGNRCQVWSKSAMQNHLCPLVPPNTISAFAMARKGRETKSDSERMGVNKNYCPGLSAQSISGEGLIVHCQETGSSPCATTVGDVLSNLATAWLAGVWHKAENTSVPGIYNCMCATPGPSAE